MSKILFWLIGILARFAAGSESIFENSVNSVDDVINALSRGINMFGNSEIDSSYIIEYGKYLEKFSKLNKYLIDGSDNYSELLLRYSWYLWSRNFINDYMNNSLTLNKIGHTKFSDWTQDEKHSLLLSESEMNNIINSKSGECEYFDDYSDLVWNYNWVYKNDDDETDFRSKCQAIKDQGSCGSCWDFAATAQFECNYNIYNNRYQSFSEQYVLDCTTTGSCYGGLVRETDEWIAENGHCPSEDYISYLGYESSSCLGCSDKIYPDGTACMMMDSFDDAIELSKTVTLSYWQGIDDSFYYLEYDSILYDCSYVVGYHAMTVVGQYEYWYGEPTLIVKNSWGEDWGDDGFFYLTENAANLCAAKEYTFNYWFAIWFQPSTYLSYIDKFYNMFNINNQNYSIIIFIINCICLSLILICCCIINKKYKTKKYDQYEQIV